MLPPSSLPLSLHHHHFIKTPENDSKLYNAHEKSPRYLFF